MRLEADDGRPETSPPLRRGVQTADRAVVRERQAIPEDPPSWPDILRTIELGYSNARLEASDNRIKVTIRMAYGFHHANSLIALVMLAMVIPWSVMWIHMDSDLPNLSVLGGYCAVLGEIALILLTVVVEFNVAKREYRSAMRNLSWIALAVALVFVGLTMSI